MRKPKLDKAEAPLQSVEDHARALELACRTAAQIIASTPQRQSADAQEPPPASSVRWL